jgi:glycosyltransferase involved in cell wall biosynthesis
MSAANARVVIVTAAHNEAEFVARTCASMATQTRRPDLWVIVDDASSDDTPKIVSAFAAEHPDWVQFVRVRRPPGRDFRHKVNAFDVGRQRAARDGCDYLGNLDADIELPADYYARVLQQFEAQPRLGLCGGVVHSCIGGIYVDQEVAPDSVAGAVQLFRRCCFEQIGGYRALPLGGVDAAAEISARHAGWLVRSLPTLAVREHRRTGSSTATPLRARLREGRRMYALGYAFSFFVARCLRRSLERPALVGSAAALAGFAVAALRREAHALPLDVIAFLRQEQRGKLTRRLAPR